MASRISFNTRLEQPQIGLLCLSHPIPGSFVLPGRRSPAQPAGRDAEKINNAIYVQQRSPIDGDSDRTVTTSNEGLERQKGICGLCRRGGLG